jgi:hypothetical protein
MQSRLADIDLSDLTSNTMLVNGSFASYATYFRKFATFLGLDYTPDFVFDSTHLCDHIAKFLVAMGREYNYKPHHKKSGLAALSHLLKLAGVPNFFDFAHLWPKTTCAIMAWETFLKQNPYQPVQASEYSAEAMNYICGLTFDDTGELSDLAIVCTCNWTSMRAKDLQ